MSKINGKNIEIIYFFAPFNKLKLTGTIIELYPFVGIWLKLPGNEVEFKYLLGIFSPIFLEEVCQSEFKLKKIYYQGFSPGYIGRVFQIGIQARENIFPELSDRILP